MSDLGDAKSVRISLLGPVQVTRESVPVELGATRLKTLLALLCIRRGRPVTAERLIDELWEEDPPAGAKSTLQSYVSNLRRELGADVILTSSGGYGLGSNVDLDLAEFEDFVDMAHREPNSFESDEAHHQVVERACSLWRGSFVEDIRQLERLERFAKVVEEKRLMVMAMRLDVAIERSPEHSLPELRELRAENPCDERFVCLLMRVLANLDRHAEALRECHEYRQELIERTGIGPSSSVRELEALIASNEVPFGVEHLQTSSHNVVASSPRNSFIDRQLLLEQVCKTLQRQRLVTLVGPGGVGKSRLAVEAVDRVRGLFDQVHTSDLSEEPDLTSTVQKIRALAGHISLADLQTRHLVLLESCERFICEVSVEINQLLRGQPNVHVVVTSRVRTNVSLEQVVIVPPLTTQSTDCKSLSPASNLFVDRLESLGASVDQDDWTLVEQIVSAADGLPYAIELAAERAAGLGLQALAGENCIQLRDLSSDRFDETHRHRSMSSMIRWTLDSLEPNQRRLVAALAVFEAPFTYAAAEVVGDATGVDVGSVLTRLIDQSLVLKIPDVATGHRYATLRTVREFLKPELAELDCRADVERAMFRFFASFIAEVAPDIRSMSAVQRAAIVSPDQPNLLVGLRLARRHESFPDVVDLLWAFIWHCHELEDVAEIGEWVRRSLVDEVSASASVIARAHVGVVAVGFYLGTQKVSLGQAADAVRHARVAEDSDLLADALSLQGATAIDANDLPCAFAALAEATELCRSIGHLWGLAIVDLFASIAERRAQRLELSYEVGRRALKRLVYLDDKRGIAMATQSIARTLHEMGRVSDAREFASQSYEVASEIQDHAALAMAALAYGRAVTSVEDLNFGRSLFVEALLSSFKTQNKILLSSSLEWIAFVDYFRLEDHGRLVFVDGFTSQYRNGVARPAHEAVLKKARKSLGGELFDIERRRGRGASVDEVLARLSVKLDQVNLRPEGS